jgi:hypothetical protein
MLAGGTQLMVLAKDIFTHSYDGPTAHTDHDEPLLPHRSIAAANVSAPLSPTLHH